jgi:hypothetical protein
MHRLTEYFKPHLAKILEDCRKYLQLTQVKMAEEMAISSRFYHDLKYGISMMSLVQFLFLLKLLSDNEKLILIHQLEALIESESYREFLDKIDFI